jgi:hypothetical protein
MSWPSDYVTLKEQPTNQPTLSGLPDRQTYDYAGLQVLHKAHLLIPMYHISIPHTRENKWTKKMKQKSGKKESQTSKQVA